MLYLHYHIELIAYGGRLYCPHYFSAWINGFNHHSKQKIGVIAYVVQVSKELDLTGLEFISEDVVVISLGPKPKTILKQVLLWKTVFYKVSKVLCEGDTLLLRLPTVLYLPIILAFKKKRLTIDLLLVGHIRKARQVLSKTFKGFVINQFWNFESFYIKRQILKKNIRVVLTNGVAPALDYDVVDHSRNVFTSTIWESQLKKIEPNASDRNYEVRNVIVITRNSEEKSDVVILREIANTLNITLHIVGIDGQNDQSTKFYGHLERKQFINILDKCDLGIVLSSIDWQPRVVWEYLSRGLPVLLYRGVRGQYWGVGYTEDAVLPLEKITVEAIGKAIEKLENKTKSDILQSSYRIASSRTVEKSSKLMLELLN